MIEFRKIDSSKNEAKYWRIGFGKSLGVVPVVRIEWGRIGTKGSSKDFVQYSTKRAGEFIEKRTAEKLREGYRRVRYASPQQIDPADLYMPSAKADATMSSDTGYTSSSPLETGVRRAARAKPVPEPQPIVGVRRITFDGE